MSAILVVAFLVGMAVAIVRKIFFHKPKTVIRARHRQGPKSKLDTVDHMVLYGEVTGDDFYGM